MISCVFTHHLFLCEGVMIRLCLFKQRQVVVQHFEPHFIKSLSTQGCKFRSELWKTLVTEDSPLLHPEMQPEMFYVSVMLGGSQTSIVLWA